MISCKQANQSTSIQTCLMLIVVGFFAQANTWHRLARQCSYWQRWISTAGVLRVASSRIGIGRVSASFSLTKAAPLQSLSCQCRLWKKRLETIRQPECVRRLLELCVPMQQILFDPKNHLFCTFSFSILNGIFTEPTKKRLFCFPGT